MSVARRFLRQLYKDYGEPLVDEIVEALGGEADEQTVRRAVAAAAPTKPKAEPNAPAIVRRVSGANRRAADRAPFDARELAVRYPRTAPPIAQIDKKSGREFMAKQLSPEAEALSVARRRAQSEIDTGDYTPYFDPSQRFYADPSQYNLQGNTLQEAIPKKPETYAKYEAMASEPSSLRRLAEAYNLGSQLPGAEDWYAMGQLEKSFVDQYGPEMGRLMFKERFADAMAATTGGADPTSNLMMAQFGNIRKAAGQDITIPTYDLPFPIGGRYAAGNIAQYDKMLGSGAQGLTVANPKRFNFSANFLGDTKRATIDEQMSGLFDPNLAQPPGPSYGVFEQVLGDLASKYGVDPANFQDVAWAGAKIKKTPKYRPKPMIEIVNEAIERTARLTGQDPDDVVQAAIVKAERPLYAEGGLVVPPAERGR
jgi:hypothetical protein